MITLFISALSVEQIPQKVLLLNRFKIVSAEIKMVQLFEYYD